MKARKYIEEEVRFENGSVATMIVWVLPRPTKDRPHGYKYRLNYFDNRGVTLVRYDNCHGKGDHKHILGKQFAISFSDIDQVILDFRRDVLRILERGFNDKEK